MPSLKKNMQLELEDQRREIEDLQNVFYPLRLGSETETRESPVEDEEETDDDDKSKDDYDYYDDEDEIEDDHGNAQYTEQAAVVETKTAIEEDE